jgi:hypothetical protein
MPNKLLWHEPEWRQVAVTLPGQTTTPRTYALAVPSPKHATAPSGGWPLDVFIRGQSYISSHVSTSATVYPVGGGAALTGLEPLMAEMLARGHAVMLADSTWPWSAAGVKTTVHPEDASALPGVGICHPPPKTLVPFWVGADVASNAWSDINTLFGYKDVAHAVMHARENAATYNIDPARVAVLCEAGSDAVTSYGSAPAQVAAWLGLFPDAADPAKSDFRRQSSRVQACYMANGHTYWPAFEQGVGGGNGLDNFSVFPDAGGDMVNDLAATFAAAPTMYQLLFSPLFILGATASHRRINVTDAQGCKFYVYTGGYSQIAAADSWGKDSAGVDITLSGLIGAYDVWSGKAPNYVGGTGKFDCLSTNQEIRAAAKHSPHHACSLVRMLRDAGAQHSSTFHDDETVLVGDANTKATAAAFGQTEADFESTTFEPTDYTDRILHVADWLQAAI